MAAVEVKSWCYFGGGSLRRTGDEVMRSGTIKRWQECKVEGEGAFPVPSPGHMSNMMVSDTSHHYTPSLALKCGMKPSQENSVHNCEKLWFQPLPLISAWVSVILTNSTPSNNEFIKCEAVLLGKLLIGQM